MTKSFLYKSAFILGFSSLLSRALGVVRDNLLARFFGAGGEGLFNLDVYYAAFRIPDFIYGILIMGTVAAAFVPVFTSVMHRDGGGLDLMSADASRFTSNVLNTLLIVVLLASGLMFFLAPWFVQFLVPGFGEADLTTTVAVTRLMLFSPILFGLSAVLQSVQNAYNRFFYYSLAPILYNLGIVCGIVFMAPTLGIWGVAIGVLAGASLHFLIQIPGVLGLRFKYSFYISWKDSHLREMIRLFVPRVIGMSIMQVNLIFDTLVGSLLATGSITVLNYAVNLNSLPMGLIGVSFAIASFATLSGLAIQSRGKFAKELSKVVTAVLYFVVPAGVGLFVLRFQIVDLILGYGEFGDRDVVLTGNTLAFFLIGLIGQSLIPVFARAFYAFKNTMIPVVISVACMVLNVALNFYFALTIGVGVYGIALATGLTSFLNMVLLAVSLKRKFLPDSNFIEWNRVGPIVFSGLSMGVVVYFLNFQLANFSSVSLTHQILACIASIFVGIVIYLLCITPFGLRETDVLLRRLRLLRRP